MDSSPRSPMTSSMADSPTRGGNVVDEGSAPGPPVGGGVPYNPYPLAGGGGAGGYVGYYMGPPHGMGGGIPHGGYGMPYGGAVGPVGATSVGPPPPHHGYAMHPHPQVAYGSRGAQGPPGGAPPTGMPAPYGRSYGMYEYYGAGPGGQPIKSHQQPTQQATQERSSPSSPSSKSTRGGFHGSSPRSAKDGPSSGSKSSPLAAESRTDESSPSRPVSSKSTDELDLNRSKSAEADLTPSDVKPLQSDFHFFVLAVKDRLRLEAEREVKFSLKNSSKVTPDSLHLQYLINTNLNARLMKEWEDMKMEDKEIYLKKEEEDRKRFMEEDEVASRHCATLTARVKGSGDGGGRGGKDSSPGRPKQAGKGRSSKFGLAEGAGDSYSDAEDDADLQIQATESQDDEDEDDEPADQREPKRSTGETDEADQSPSKKNRVDSEE